MGYIFINIYICTWWRHQMETFSALLAICAGNSPVPSDLSAQRPATRRFDVFLSSASELTFEKTIARLVRRYRAHYDVIVMKWQWLDLFKTRSSLLKLQGNFCTMASNIPAADDDRNNHKCTWPSQLPWDYGLPHCCHCCHYTERYKAVPCLVAVIICGS